MKPEKKNKKNRTDTIKKKTEAAKEIMLSCLEQQLGIVTAACQRSNISRSQHYKWLEEDFDYKKKVEEISEMAIDLSESKLYEKIKGIKVQGEKDIYKIPPSDAAIIFHLKTKGKRRGYVEKSEVDMTIAVPQLVYKYDDESQRKLLEENE